MASLKTVRKHLLQARAKARMKRRKRASEIERYRNGSTPWYRILGPEREEIIRRYEKA